MIKAVIFDMDGLLIDSEPLWHRAEIQCFTNVGLELDPELCMLTTGLRLDEVVRYWYRRRPWQGLSPEQLEAAILDRVCELVEEQGRALEGVDSTLELCRSLGLPLVLASSSARRLIDRVLDKLAIGHYFDAVISAESEDYGKPHPAVYLNAARAVEVDPTECLALEDSFNGLLAAKAARMKTVVVPHPAEFDLDQFVIADLKLHSLAEFSRDHLALIEAGSRWVLDPWGL